MYFLIPLGGTIKLMKRHWGIYIGLVLVGGLVSSLYQSSLASAETSKSPNYQATDTQFGTGLTTGSCSDKYCSEISIGSMSNDGASSAHFSAVEDKVPQLDVIIESKKTDLGELKATKTSSKTLTVKVRNYMSGGYGLKITGTPPSIGEHALETLKKPTESETGTEQFGINVVANTTPAIGEDPAQKLDNPEMVGTVQPDYAQADKFMYRDGDIFALSRSNSSQTDYTLSMIINVSNSTPVGHYTSDFSIMIVPMY